MVKLGRGGMNPSHRGRSKPRPLFPPGELPLFGPPPVYMRRPGPPVPPPARAPMGYDYGPPPIRPPPHLGPPHLPPPPHLPMRGRPPVGPPPPMPLLQAPVPPPRPLPFLRGRGPLGPPRMGPAKKLGKAIKKSKNRRNKKGGAPTTSTTSKPEGEYYCEICDRSWVTPEELEEHISQHVTCHVDGCSFTAAPKVVALHVKLQHDTGLFDRIISNREDVDKWKEERKRNFPTLANIERKMAEKKEKEDRGERIAPMIKPFNNNRGRNNRSIGKPRDRNKRKFNAGNDSNTKFFHPEKKPKQLFLSTASLPNDSEETAAPADEDGKISDDEWISDNQGVVKAAPISKVLSLLSQSYASGDEDNEEGISSPKKTADANSDDEPPSEEKIGRQSDSNTNIQEVVETEVDKVTEKFSKRKRSHNKNKLKPKHEVKDWKPTLRKRPPTLLEKLLATEIKQERNYILQCIRYIISENFFDEN